MGAVFFFTLMPVLLMILGIIVAIGIIGAVVFIVGIGGSIVSAAAIDNKELKRVCLFFFISLLLLGISCLAVSGGIFGEVYFFIIPTLIISGTAVAVLGIIGIIEALKVKRTAAKITLVVLLSLSTCLGAIVLAAGALAAFSGT